MSSRSLNDCGATGACFISEVSRLNTTVVAIFLPANPDSFPQVYGRYEIHNLVHFKAKDFQRAAVLPHRAHRFCPILSCSPSKGHGSWRQRLDAGASQNCRTQC